MVLAMARPFQHPKTGIFWLRKRVPLDLVARVGKREERFSLKTRDPSEAKRRHAEEVAQLERRWSNLRRGVRQLSEREAHELAKIAHDNWVAMFRDEPSEQLIWQTGLYGDLWIGTAYSNVPPEELERDGIPV